jgi:hypothetical protein
MRHLTVALTLTIGLSFAACGSKDTSAPPATGTVAEVPTPGQGPTGQNIDPRTCELGQVHTAAYGCLNRCDGPDSSGYGWYASEQRCLPGTIITHDVKYGTNYGSRFSGTLSIVNRKQFETFLKHAGKCDQYTWTFGTYACSYYSSKGYLDITSIGSDGTSANLIVAAGISNPGTYVGWYYSKGVMSVSQQAAVQRYNEDRGMVLTGITYWGGGVGLRVVVDEGNMTSSNSFNVKAYYQETLFASGYVTRY